MKRFFIVLAGIVLGLGVLKGIVAYFYWQNLKSTPQYSLALVVDAARRDDKALVAELVDSNAVVDDMMPQVVEKAVELYGRGVAPDIITKAMTAAVPLMPAVKDVVRPEVAKLIRRETERYGDVPFPLMVLGAGRYIDVQFEGDKALVRSKRVENATEITMVRSGGRWKIAGVRDEKFATEIAQRVGQQILSLTNGRGNREINSLIERLKQETQTQ